MLRLGLMLRAIRIASLAGMFPAALLLIGAAGLEELPRRDIFSPVDRSAVPSDVFAVVAKDSFVRTCAIGKGDPAAYARTFFKVKHATLSDGTELFEASPINDETCVYGAVFVLAKSARDGIVRLALKTGGMLFVSSDGSAVVYGFGSCCEANRKKFRFDGTAFDMVDHDRVKVESDDAGYEITAVKPDAIDVRFAPGTSSATLSGKTESGFEDVYRLTALRGQTLSVSTVTTGGNAVQFAVAPDRGGKPLYDGFGARWSGKLPVDGAYLITVGIVDGSTEGDRPIPYTITFGIK